MLNLGNLDRAYRGTEEKLGAQRAGIYENQLLNMINTEAQEPAYRPRCRILRMEDAALTAVIPDFDAMGAEGGVV